MLFYAFRFSVDYQKQEYLDNTICTFGKVLSQKKDMSILTRLIVKVGVLDLESVVHHIILSDAEDFQGESWTIQCEVTQNDLLVGLPSDEYPMPNDHINPNASFDRFGYRQVGLILVDEGENENNNAPYNQAIALWEPWLDNLQAQPNQGADMPIPSFNLGPGINLNELPMEKDMIIGDNNGGEILNLVGTTAKGEILMGETFIEFIDLMPNVIEVEIDLNVAELEMPFQVLQAPPIVQGLQAPLPLVNFLIEEIYENMLMEDDQNLEDLEEIHLEDQHHLDIQPPQGNLQLGMVGKFFPTQWIMCQLTFGHPGQPLIRMQRQLGYGHNILKIPKN